MLVNEVSMWPFIHDAGRRIVAGIPGLVEISWGIEKLISSDCCGYSRRLQETLLMLLDELIPPFSPRVVAYSVLRVKKITINM